MPRAVPGVSRPLTTAERQERHRRKQAALLAFARAAYRDNAYLERLCDHCGKPYRGPAVYCCLECAMAAA